MLKVERIPVTTEWKDLGNIANHRIYTKGKLLLEIHEATDYHTTIWQTDISDREAIKKTLEMQDEFVQRYYRSQRKAYPNPIVTVQREGLLVLNGYPLYDFLRDENASQHLSHPDLQVFRIDMPGNDEGIAFAYDKTLPTHPPVIGIIAYFDLSEFLPKWIRNTSINGAYVNKGDILPILKRIYKRYPNP